MKPPKILLIANNVPPVRGGSAVVYDNLARHAGRQIIVLAPRKSYLDGLPIIGWRENDLVAPYPIIRLPLLRTVLSASEPRRWIPRIRNVIDDVRIRLSVAFKIATLIAGRGVRALCAGELVASSWIVSLFGRVPGLRLIVYIHGEEITTFEPFDPDFSRRRRALLAADRIVVVSRFTESAVLGLLGERHRSKVRLIENGVDTTRFRPLGKDPGLLDLYGLRSRFVFVSVCRLLEKKGLDHAIRAFATVAEYDPDSRYLIVGGGPYAAELRQIAVSAGLADKVIFAGPVIADELVEHYCLGDVFVMPNRRLPNGDTEGFGLVFLEANSCGLPVIAGQDGGSTDAVKDGVNGLVVNGHSVEEIARAMLWLRRDDGLRERIQTEAKAVAMKADWSTKAAAFVDVCLGGGQDVPAAANLRPRQS